MKNQDGRRAAARVWLKRVWLVLTDHSVGGGIFRTKREARAAVDLREIDSVLQADYLVAGPYVLQAKKPRRKR